MRSSPPLTFRTTPEGVFLVGTAAGPIGGDHLEVHVRVEPCAELVVRSAAATMALPGTSGAPSLAQVHLHVSRGAALWWLPEPLVLVDGCDHRVTTHVTLDRDAMLVLRDEVVLGRHREPSGSLVQRLHVNADARPLVRNDLCLGPRWPGADGPAGTGGARGVAQTFVVGNSRILGACTPIGGVRAATMAFTDTEGRSAWLRSEVTDEPGRLAHSRVCPTG